MKYKVGDRVRVVKERPKETFTEACWFDDMDSFLGLEVVISSIYSDQSYKILGCGFLFDVDWLEPVEITPQFKAYDEILVRISDRTEWIKRTFLFMGRNGEYFCYARGDDGVDSHSLICYWPHAKPIPKRTNRIIKATDEEMEEINKILNN